MTIERDSLGPAERIIETVTRYVDHLFHGRPGMVKPSTDVAGLSWTAVVTKKTEATPVLGAWHQPSTEVFLWTGKKVGPKLGILSAEGAIMNGDVKVGDYRKPGIFPEMVTWMYQQVADVWKLDNEFAARWASYIFNDTHRDLKVVLAAFLLVQNRFGAPVTEGGKTLFRDDDFRSVGEAMFLLSGKNSFSPKMLLRVHEVLMLPSVAEINRNMGFSSSTRNATIGRWAKAVHQWLRYREHNPKMLEGLVSSGQRRIAIELASRSGYKPETPSFFSTLRWQQVQSSTGHRTMAIGQEWAKAETWEGQTEEQICQRIAGSKPSWKVITSRVPANVGITQAIMASAIESGCLSKKDLVIATPTLEALGLISVPSVKSQWEAALAEAEDQRAANIARNVRSKETREKLLASSDEVLQKTVSEVTKGLVIYFFVDISGSMEGAIEEAKYYLEKFLQGFPQDKLHVAVFNTAGREVAIKHPSAAGVRQAFSGLKACGGTLHESGIQALSGYLPKSDEDSLFFFVGDEGQSGNFAEAVRRSGLRPMAFGLVKVENRQFWGRDGDNLCVQTTASVLGIPCIKVDKATFQDAYSIPRVIRNLVASTPVTKSSVTVSSRKTLVDLILDTKLLEKPAWAV